MEFYLNNDFGGNNLAVMRSVFQAAERGIFIQIARRQAAHVELEL
jgi:hypothetical protein